MGAYALMSSLLNLVANLLPEVKNTLFAPSSSSSTQKPISHTVEANLRRLERMLERIKAILYDAEDKNIEDKSVKLWLKEIKELGHEAECVLEEYMFVVYRAQVEARNASNINAENYKSHNEYMSKDENMNELYQAQVVARNLSELNYIKGDVDINCAYSVQIPYSMVDRIRDIYSRLEEIAKDREALLLLEQDAPRKEKEKVYTESYYPFSNGAEYFW